eukprot:4111437-Amphidinium_carterae.1
MEMHSRNGGCQGFVPSPCDAARLIVEGLFTAASAFLLHRALGLLVVNCITEFTTHGEPSDYNLELVLSNMPLLGCLLCLLVSLRWEHLGVVPERS